MVLALCIGDFHIPFRAADFPAKFRQLLAPGKIQHVLCTGDLCIKVRGHVARPRGLHTHVSEGLGFWWWSAGTELQRGPERSGRVGGMGC